MLRKIERVSCFFERNDGRLRLEDVVVVERFGALAENERFLGPSYGLLSLFTATTARLRAVDVEMTYERPYQRVAVLHARGPLLPHMFAVIFYYILCQSFRTDL